MSTQTLKARKRRVFNSVFGVTTISQPTPVVTPATAFTGPGEAFGGPTPPSHESVLASLSSPLGWSVSKRTNIDVSDHVQDQVRWDRSWHLVTRTLQLPNFPEHRGILEPLNPDRDSVGPDFYQALENVLYPQARVPFARQTEDIVIWHTYQVRNHFLQQVLPILFQLKEHHDADAILLRGIKVLETAHRQYLHGLSFIKEQIDLSTPGTSEPVIAKFRRDLHAIIGNSVMEALSSALTSVMKRYVSTVLGLTGSPSVAAEGSGSEKARRELLGLVETLKNIGLAGESFQVIFAEVMNAAMSEFVYRDYQGVWSPQPPINEPLIDTESSTKNESKLPKTTQYASPSLCVTDICEWVENRYAKLAVQVLSILATKVNISWADKEKLKEMSIGRLADLRTNELFEVIQNWPNNSAALDDLRTAITTPQRRLQLTEMFSQTLSQRLLHPGASTLQILQTYISMIWSFHSLDHSKVLLDRVAYPLQLYLCSREDTVRIIITGLLADIGEVSGNANGVEKLVELAELLDNGGDLLGQRVIDEELDWNDMEWVPDPVDAGPGYKRSKNADIIGTLIGFLGSQEIFIKEFQTVIGENFLKYDGLFEREIKVLELLKVRFGEAPLQACEVMLKDIQDSGRVNSIIRKTQNLDYRDHEAVPPKKDLNKRDQNPTAEEVPKSSLNAKILSRLFWPQLQDESYRVPQPIFDLQKQYESGFESLKASRKLSWLHALGQATVELELQDRTILEEVHTWQATIIWAFQSDSSDNGIRKSIDELVEHLDMDEALVRSGLKFWVHKLVLQEVSPNTFAVLETLNQEDRARSNAQSAASHAAGENDDGADDTAMAANDGIEKEKMAIYWQFIHGMLTNSSSQMPLQQIAMMLKMLIVDGFPYSNEELQEFLAQKIAAGELEIVSGKYKLKK